MTNQNMKDGSFVSVTVPETDKQSEFSFLMCRHLIAIQANFKMIWFTIDLEL